MNSAEIHVLDRPAVDRPPLRQGRQRRFGKARLDLDPLAVPVQARRFDRIRGFMPKSTVLLITCSRAVRMRLLPPLPGSIAPPPANNNDGAIIEATRSPGGLTWNPSGCRSSSPIMLLSMMPVPGAK